MKKKGVEYHAEISRIEAQTGVPERSESPVQDHELTGSDAGQQDHKEGASDGEETQARSEVGEQWRGTYCGSTFRIFIKEKDSFHPRTLHLQRLISFYPSEPETWVNVFGGVV